MPAKFSEQQVKALLTNFLEPDRNHLDEKGSINQDGKMSANTLSRQHEYQ